MQRLTVQQAAERLGISVDTVRRRIKAGSLRSEREIRPQGHSWIVLMGDDDQEPVVSTPKPANDLRFAQEMLAELRADRDHWRDMALGQQRLLEHIQLTAPTPQLQPALSQQPVSDEPRWTVTEPATRTWRWPWQRPKLVPEGA